MKLQTTFGLALLVGLLGSVMAADDPSGPKWGDAQWIWSSRDAASTSRDFQCFRKKWDLPAQPKEATIVLIADNGFDLFVNGQLGNSPPGWATKAPNGFGSLICRTRFI